MEIELSHLLFLIAGVVIFAFGIGYWIGIRLFGRELRHK